VRGEYAGMAGATGSTTSLINRLGVSASDRSEGRRLLWVNIRSLAVSVFAVNVMFLTADSVVAGEVSTHLRPLALVEDWPREALGWLDALVGSLGDFIGQSRGQTTALLLGLGIVVIVPVFLVAGAVLRRSVPMETGQTVLYPGTRKRTTVTPAMQTHRLPVIGDASVTIEDAGGSQAAEHRFNGALMVRIGREDDNDVCLSDPTVHRYHAVISWSADAGFVISDLSSSDGNGVIVNDERVRRQRLNDGDIITLGTSKLTFRLQ